MERFGPQIPFPQGLVAIQPDADSIASYIQNLWSMYSSTHVTQGTDFTNTWWWRKPSKWRAVTVYFPPSKALNLTMKIQHTIESNVNLMSGHQVYDVCHCLTFSKTSSKCLKGSIVQAFYFRVFPIEGMWYWIWETIWWNCSWFTSWRARQRMRILLTKHILHSDMSWIPKQLWETR